MSPIPSTDVAIIGGGVVGAAIMFHLTHCGANTALYEKEASFALAASGTNSGCLHTGFDSIPGELETSLILRSAQLRPQIIETLGIPVLQCGAELIPRNEADQEVLQKLADNATKNGVVTSVRDSDGALEIPGEWITDPVVYTQALLTSATDAGATVASNKEVIAIASSATGFTIDFADGTQATARYIVNAAGLFADAVASMIGDNSFEIYPRKGEFLVFNRPEEVEINKIILPIPTRRTKGILIFPTLDGNVIAGPTAVDLSDKSDWSVRPEAAKEIIDKVKMQIPAFERATPIASYCGLRTAGVDANYIIEVSDRNSSFINVAAIRSTGLSASLGIGEYVTHLLSEQGLSMREFILPDSTSRDAPRHSSDVTTNEDSTYPQESASHWWARSAHHFNQQPFFLTT